MPEKLPLRVGLAGLGAVGLEVAKRLIDGAVPGLTLAAVAVRDVDKARRTLPQVGDVIALRPPPRSPTTATWSSNACRRRCSARSRSGDRARPHLHAAVGRRAVSITGTWSTRAEETGARILVPTGALLGLDAVRAAAEGDIHSVTMITRKPPAGLDGAPYLVERSISVEGLNSAAARCSTAPRARARAAFPPTSTWRRR